MAKFPFRMAACVAALLVLLAMTLVVASRRSGDSTQPPTASTRAEAALHGAPASAAAAGTGQARPVLSPMVRYREAARLDLLIADLEQRFHAGLAALQLARPVTAEREAMRTFLLGRLAGELAQASTPSLNRPAPPAPSNLAR
jgi:hypothetical protein